MLFLCTATTLSRFPAGIVPRQTISVGYTISVYQSIAAAAMAQKNCALRDRFQWPLATNSMTGYGRLRSFVLRQITAHELVMAGPAPAQIPHNCVFR